MLYTEIKKIPYIDLRIGIKFYFYEDPINCKNEIKEIFNMYCNITKTPFTFYRHNKDEGLKGIKRDHKQLLYRIIDKSNFSLSEHIILTNATSEALQSIKCEMMLCNYEPAYALRLPNRMYFEFLPSISYEEIFGFICFACKTIKMHYCCCNPLIGVNEHYQNRSNSYAVKEVKKQICLTDKYSIFDNWMLLKDLKTKIDGPNAIQVFSKTLYELIGREMLISKCHSKGIYCEVEGDYIITSISKEKMPEYDEEFLSSYISLNEILKGIILDMEKPRMYWKIDEWNLWKNRFNGK